MVEHQLECGITTRIISHEKSVYLNSIVGIDGWINFAIALKAYAYSRQATSSRDIYQDSVYLMLMGYALEDVAKCIISCKAYNAKIKSVTPFEEKIAELEFTRKDGKKCKDDKKKCKLTTHDLDDLYSATDLGFDVSPTEIDHLKVISNYTLWKGRYPVPLFRMTPPSSEPSFEDLSKTAIGIYDRAMTEVEKLRSSRS